MSYISEHMVTPMEPNFLFYKSNYRYTSLKLWNGIQEIKSVHVWTYQSNLSPLLQFWSHHGEAHLIFSFLHTYIPTPRVFRKRSQISPTAWKQVSIIFPLPYVQVILQFHWSIPRKSRAREKSEQRILFSLFKDNFPTKGNHQSHFFDFKHHHIIDYFRKQQSHKNFS